MTTNLQNDRFLRAILRQPVDRTPVWMMRQAGRYLPEYRKLRAQVPDFMTFCRNTEMAAEVTVQPLDRFPLDAAIVFSDILTVPQAMGADLKFEPGVGPKIYNPVRSQKCVDQLIHPDVNDSLQYVMDAVSASRKAINNRVPLIGFAGSPWTVATYMVEGGSSKLFKEIKTLAFRDPKVMHDLLKKITDVTIDYLQAQIAAGAQALMVFDSWGGVLSPSAYNEFSLPYLKHIARSLKREIDGNYIPLVFYGKGCGQWLEALADSGCDALGLDWTTDVGLARKRVGDKVALQGNLDPMVLFGTKNSIRDEVQRILAAFGPRPGHVFNLGHGIDKDTPIENVEAMIAAVQEFSLVTQ